MTKRERWRVELIKDVYKPGMKVVLDSMDDPQAPPPGTEGEVICVDDIGTIHVKWKTGGSLGLLSGVDMFHVVS